MNKLPLLVLASIMLLASCRRDMQDQPRYKPLRSSNFFSDGRASRPIPAGTIARGELNDDDPFHTGATPAGFIEAFPLPVTTALLQRGHERFDIFCSPCHGRIGDGNGMIAQRGLKYPSNLLGQRIREAPPGYLFQVISDGYGAMGGYKDQVPVRDRWAIIAYIRALELSQNAQISDVPPAQQGQFGGAR